MQKGKTKRYIFPLWKTKFSILFGIFISISNVQAFLDISPNDPQIEIFSHLRDVRIMNGYQDGKFHPEKQLTRAEALAITLKSGNIKIPQSYSGITHFIDVNPNQWYAPLVQRALERNIVSVNAGYFRPQEPVTKAEFLALLLRSTKVDLQKYTRTRTAAKDINLNTWLGPIFAYAQKYQIAHIAPDGFYRPEKKLTRREAAMMTYRQLRVFHGNIESKLLIELQGEMQRFLAVAKQQNFIQANKHLHRILQLNRDLVRKKNNIDAVAAKMLAKSMEHLSESLRYFKNGSELTGIENLHLALKFSKRAGQKSEKILGFANELEILIGETLMEFSNPTPINFTATGNLEG